MARPKKLTLDFFVHDSHASSDIKLRRLEKRHKCEGYSTYFKILELLCQNDGMKLDLSDGGVIEILADDFNLRDSAHLLCIIQDCTEVGLFDKQLWQSERIVFSQGLYKRYLSRLEERKQAAQRKQRHSDASKLNARIQEIKAKENEVFHRDNPVSSCDNSPELSELSELSEPQNSQNAQRENLGGKEFDDFSEDSEPSSYHDEPEPPPVQNNSGNPQPIAQDTTAPVFSGESKKYSHPTERCEARSRGVVYPWSDSGKPKPEFAEFVGKQLPRSEAHPKVKGRQHIINAENGDADIRKIWCYWEDYQELLDRKAKNETVIAATVYSATVSEVESPSSQLDRLRGLAKIDRLRPRAIAEARAAGIALADIGLEEVGA